MEGIRSSCWAGHHRDSRAQPRSYLGGWISPLLSRLSSDGGGGGGGAIMAGTSGEAAGGAGTVYALLLLEGALLAAVADGTVRVWQRARAPAASRLIDDDGDGADEPAGAAARGWVGTHCCAAHTGSALCLAAAADGRVYSGSSDRSLACCRLPARLGDADPRAAAAAPASLPAECTAAEAHEAEVHALVVRGELVLSGGADCAVRGWSLELAPLYSLGGAGAAAHRGAVYALLVVPPPPAAAAPPRLFSGAADKLIKVWDLRTLDCVRCLAGHRSFVCALQARAATAPVACAFATRDAPPLSPPAGDGLAPPLRLERQAVRRVAPAHVRAAARAQRRRGRPVQPGAARRARVLRLARPDGPRVDVAR